MSSFLFVDKHKLTRYRVSFCKEKDHFSINLHKHTKMLNLDSFYLSIENIIYNNNTCCGDRFGVLNLPVYLV